MLLIGDMDGNQYNIGFIPTQDGYTTTKIDHEEALNTFISDFTLATLGKIAMGEGINFLAAYFDYYKFNLNQLADDFDLIARSYSDPSKREALVTKINSACSLIQKNVVGKSSESFLRNRDKFLKINKNILLTLEDRLAATVDYATSMRVEAAIKSGSLQDLEKLSIDINSRFHSLFIRQFDSEEEMGSTFLDIGAAWVQGYPLAEHWLMTINDKEQPLTPLMMAIYYNKSFGFIQSLAERSNKKTLEEAISLAQTLQKLDIHHLLTTVHSSAKLWLQDEF